MPGRTKTAAAAPEIANTKKKAIKTVAERPAAKVNGVAPVKKRKVGVETDEKPAEVEEPKQKKTKVAPLKETTPNGTAKNVAKTTKTTKTAAKVTKPTAAKKAKIPEQTLEEAVNEKLAIVEIPIKAISPDTATKPTATSPATRKKTKAAPKTTAPTVAIGKKINDAPTQRLDVYVFGEGSSGELGLGSRRLDGKKPIDVKRPRLNPKLAAGAVGVVQASCGGMHAVALTHDNKILTWGVNDQGALGRDTNWDGGLRDVDADDSSDDEDDDDTGINPLESTPTAVSDEYFPEGTKFVQVVAGDSASFALTEDGRVYGWGTFRSADGILGFTEKVRIQSTPALLPTLKNIKALAAGSNHVLALDDKGAVLAWGAGQQNQLGRRIIERSKMSSLTPQGLGFPKRNKIVKIACGSYHSFALDAQGNVWGWGLNNFGETGIEQGAGDDEAAILKPAVIKALEGFKITDIAGGEHHSVACDDQGKLLAWGRVDGHQVGVPLEKLSRENTIYDERDQPRILFEPTVLAEVPKVMSVSAGTDNNFAICEDGQAYSWGFSGNYQTGQGTIEDIETPTLIDNTAVRGKKLVGAGAGGQYSMLFGIPGEQTMNGA